MESGSSPSIAYPRGDSPRLGVVFPQIRFFGTPEDIRTFATDVEALGFDHILAYDHVLGASKTTRPDWRGPYSSDDPFQEPFVLFSYMAAVAPLMEFATGVIILPQRQTALVAKQAANVDFLSGGKLRLGVGIGWNAVEYEGLNEAFGNRGKRFSEQIDLIRQLTTHEVIDYSGTWHRIDHAGIRPLGTQRPIPIWIGGSAEVAIRRGARIADGFMINGVTAEATEPALAILRDELARQDRDFSTYGVDIRVNVAQQDHDALKRDFERIRAANVSHVTFVTISATFDDFGEHVEHMAEAKRVWEEM
jgi:probable F420-dependent oxidoreductase